MQLLANGLKLAVKNVGRDKLNFFHFLEGEKTHPRTKKKQGGNVEVQGIKMSTFSK